MENTKKDENHNDELKLSPLGIDEINSVIKSFKTSSFNQEELYKKDEQNFVKKTLFDLAKESERNSSLENQNDSDIPIENKLQETKLDKSEEIGKEQDKKNDIYDNHFLNDLDKNNDNMEKEADQGQGSSVERVKSDETPKEKTNDEKEVDQGEGYVVEAVKSEDALDEKTNGEYDKLEEVQEKNIDENVEVSNEKIIDTNSAESNKIEYQEKTLEALDSVREAVTKSLEENSETQKKEIKKNTNDTKIVSNEIISEINLINSLFKNIREISNSEIENIVKSKVIELAEGVIGYQIEKFPDKFLNKIKNSINEIKSINTDIKIYLNDQDFDLLNKFIDKNKAEINFKLDLDTSLGRGDFTIDMGGVIQAIKYKKIIE